MAAREKTYNQITLDDGLGQDIQWIAPVIDGVARAPTLNHTDNTRNCGWSFAWPATEGLLIGARKPLPTARDISGSRFIWLAGYSHVNAIPRKFADLADGGLRFYITDSAGAYRGWTIYGRDVSGNNASPTYALRSYLNFSQALSQLWWCIDLDRTPDYSSGTLDLTDIVAIEVHAQNHASLPDTDEGRFACGYLLASDAAILRGGDASDPASFRLLPGTFAAWNDTSNPLYPGGARVQALTPIADGANGDVYQVICPVQVGDGSTATYFRQARGQIAMQLSMEAIRYRIAQGETPELLPVYLANDAEDCTHTIQQSADDDVEIVDMIWSAYDHPARGHSFEVTGDSGGACALNRNSFFRAQFVRLRHAQTTDCIFDACGPVDVTADTGLSGATIRNATATALRITTGAGDYSALDVRLNNPDAAHDIEVGAGGAGAYDLSGVTVPAGYTLKLRNASATDAVTITVPGGITTSTSTAGGAITVQQAPTTYTLHMPNVIDGSRVQIYNVTAAAELTNAVVSGGAGFEAVYTSGTDYTAGDLGRYRIAYQDGTTAKEFIEGNFTFAAATTVNSLPLTQVDQEPYNLHGADGSLIAGISWDSGNLEIDFDDADNTVEMQTIVAWYYYFIRTETGIAEALGGIVWESLNEARINVAAVDVKLDNVKAAPLKIQGGRLYRSDGTTFIAATSGSIQADVDPVYVRVVNTTGTPVITGDLADVPGAVQTGLTSQGYTTTRAAALNNLDAAISTRNATAPDNAGIAAIKQRTDNLPDDPAAQAALLAAIEDAALL